MKRLILCLVWVFVLAQFSYLVAQEEQVEQVYLGSIKDMPAIVTSEPGAVVALGVGICDSSLNSYYLIDYAGGQTWYMYLVVVNWSTSTKAFKLEFDLRYGDGASYKVTRASKSLGAETWEMYIYNVTSYVAKLGLFTLTGRVYGTGMGNDNKVTAQVISY